MIGKRVAIFFVFFAVLVAPWPDVEDVYGGMIRMLGRAAFSWGQPGREFKFEAIRRSRYRPLDTRITVVEGGPRFPGVRPRAIFLDLDMRGIGWVPTAFLAALILASPVPWARRGRALALGFGAMQVFVLLTLRVHILDNTGSPGGAVIGGLDETLVRQIGAGYFVALLVWLMVTFRLRDWEAMLMRRRTGRPPNSSDCVTLR